MSSGTCRSGSCVDDETEIKITNVFICICCHSDYEKNMWSREVNSVLSDCSEKFCEEATTAEK